MTATFNTMPEAMRLNSNSDLSDVAERAYTFQQQGIEEYSQHGYF